MNILLTGCAGFIASKVGELLVKSDNKVICLDNLNDAYDINLKEWLLQQLAQYRNF